MCGDGTRSERSDHRLVGALERKRVNNYISTFERWALERQAKKKKKNLTLETLLGDPDLALPLANYIDGTNRFKQPLGEQQHTQNRTTSRDSD